MASERYKYQKHLDNGSYGSVALYSDIFLDRNVAVKTINTSTADDIDSILEEVKLLKSVYSKHVVNLYDVVHTPTSIDIYQEYLSGEDLVNKSGKCSKAEILSLGYQLAFGLSDIHKSGICHRDIKLENAKFDAQGVLKIFDFGVSREGDPHQTQNGFGTLEYRAPEIYKLHSEQSVTVSFAADIFSYGVTMHKLAFGGACNFSGYVPKVPQSAPLFAHLGLSVTLTQLLTKTLSYNPEDRPTAEELTYHLGREITQGWHTGSFVTSSGTHFVNSANPTARLKSQSNQAITIYYNGFDFVVQEVEGDVYLNNQSAKPGNILHQACVVTFDGEQRSFVSFSSSHPEIVL
ncbi:protein kinase [Vibrio orientalis CIP 102891 = ATCC 33934]|uniref:Protein kinase n=1 Tax=Vibrio orientalis CIP 102891 = ATCC 33934 TaxID=675816 RepID=F9SML4_VIBOR|nr:protein kinase [Vibrio orientalis]EGU54069.1 protein kinase [Vibrio orientalis CIP 102891 = ATCC 33934]